MRSPPEESAVSDVEFTHEESLDRAAAAAVLSGLAAALADGDGHVELRLGGGRAKLRVPERIRAEIEVEVEHGEVSLELEISWTLDARAARRSRQPAAQQAD
ncbi:amphi-Trp domain-containing protein [Pseudonocardia kongjuensis]|uniref:amphi-Trp domain-containing protein n=1 Tax=Pseudonocardia kongjuensis TaxID=102227 RepID=UPI0031CF0ED6